ncbi:HNH endonuclease signature motif containing protein [Microbacterium sp. 1P06AB]|uniref:HNH endonuclease signature motif containing protein n=1 Tax=Microbacterium sp. 1P06AB TaxID=3132289 RepID=UPI0039A69F81
MDTINAQWQSKARGYLASRYRTTDTGCWEWSQSCSDNGYGKAKFQQVQVSAHRLSYMAHVGPIPEGMALDHLCMNKRCVNPEHLEAVTPRVNSRRAVYAYLGRNYTLCFTGRGLWQAAYELGGRPRRRKHFRSKDRAEAVRKVESFIADLVP